MSSTQKRLSVKDKTLIRFVIANANRYDQWEIFLRAREQEPILGQENVLDLYLKYHRVLYPLMTGRTSDETSGLRKPLEKSSGGKIQSLGLEPLNSDPECAIIKDMKDRCSNNESKHDGTGKKRKNEEDIVQSCNACKMFFRRHVVRTAPLKPCSGLESCFEVTPRLIDCQFCRFYKCVQAGMTLQPLIQKTTFVELIQFIAQLDFTRNFTLTNCYPLNPDFTVATVISENVQYTSSPFIMNYQSWAYISTVSTIDFMKKFPFLYFTKSQDQVLIMKAYFIKVSSFCAAFWAYSNGIGSLCFPDGNDILPRGDSGNIELENRIRCRLVKKLYELKVSNEEFLLILVILFSNPAIPNISSTARILSSTYRNFYSSALFEYCMLTYQKYGPTRYTELLSIFNVIAKHYEDLNQYFVLQQLNGMDLELDEIVKEGLDLL